VTDLHKDASAREVTQGNEVVMPRLGLTMTEAMITQWLKSEGAWVEKGELLFALEHEKATLEIESPASGYLHILVPEGEVVPILVPIARLVEVKTNDAGQTRVTPKARVLARKQGVELQNLAGSGPRGMIVAADVQATLQARSIQSAQQAEIVKPVKLSPVAQKVAREMDIDLTSASGSGPHGQVMRRDVEKMAREATTVAPQPGLAALPGLRGVIAKRLSESWRERPQATLTTDADATALVALRAQAEAEWGLKLSYNAVLIKLVARALQEHHNINARLTEEGIQVLPEIHIGLAADTDRGLLVPVVHNANQKTLFEIDEELHGLIQRAIEGSSQSDDLSGGTFTITNLGMYGIDAFIPLINPPECAILGVGRIQSRPVALDGQIVLRDRMALSLSFDHRLVDGGPAARFLQRVVALIERCGLIGLEK
jgi:pyruvate dehydrogenase E2 component (dihydrolipoamide acetyltransferase)